MADVSQRTQSSSRIFGAVPTSGKSSKSKRLQPKPSFKKEADRLDEDEQSRYTQTIDLLLAAGYFRARIKGLSEFDAVVGGMVWCIQMCAVDIDVDILFTENSTIGEKIALSEKIIKILRSMKCPKYIEPQEIQSLNYVTILSVVQWLVKKAMETRAEMGDQVRAFSLLQFHKNSLLLPGEEDTTSTENAIAKSFSTANKLSIPRRKYKRSRKIQIPNERTLVQCALLEFRSSAHHLMKPPAPVNENEERKNDPANDGDKPNELVDENEMARLMDNMSTSNETGRVSSQVVGKIFSLQSDKIQEAAALALDKQQSIDVTATVARQHKKHVTQLEEKISSLNQQIEEGIAAGEAKRQEYKSAKLDLSQLKSEIDQSVEQLEELTAQETPETRKTIEQLNELVVKYEACKARENAFKAKCKNELASLNANLKEWEEKVSNASIDDFIDADTLATLKIIEEKATRAVQLQAKRNREIANLQRKVDEVPSRAELNQYQRRFAELNTQIQNKHRETKHYFNLYNTLDNTKIFMDKELALLNSIHDTFQSAMNSPANKKEFLNQLDAIVDGVCNSKDNILSRQNTEKKRRDGLNVSYLDLIDKQRLYYKTVKDFQDECKKNEVLLQQVKG